MKILHFIYDHINNPWVGGGGAVRVYEIYKRLSEKGHKVKVVSGNYPGAKDYSVNTNFEYTFIGKPTNYMLSTFSYAFEAFTLAKKIKDSFDVIVEDFAPWNPLFCYRIKEKKVIIQLHHVHGLDILKRYNLLGLPFFFIEKRYPKFFKNVIVVSQASKEKFGINNAEVIPNGVEFVERQFVDGEYVAYIGRIDLFSKGLDILIKAMSNIKGVELLVAGSGKDKDEFLRLIQDIPNIKFLGKIKDKYEFIRNSKFVVMPSRFEGQGIVALEAAAMGKPVIVSDIPELDYVVKAGFGLSFRKGNYLDLREKIERMNKDDNLRKQFGENGIKYAEKFLWDNIANQYEKYIMKAFI